MELTFERKNGVAVFEVRDNAAGIDPEFLPHIFERCRQAESATSSRVAGLGVGLSLVRELAYLHGGSVPVESEPGKGSRFIVELPFSAQDA